MVAFLQLLSKLGIKSANSVVNDVIEDNEGDWTICSDCAEIKNDCRCDYHGYWDDPGRFDDESSYD